jgi:hypothetical protein
MAYDNPEFQEARELHTGHITGAAGASMQKFHFFQAARLKKVHALVVTAGTNTAAAVDVFVGTASVGSLAFGTNTAGTVLHSALLNATIPADGLVELKGIANSATLVGAFNIEYQLTPDAVRS